MGKIIIQMLYKEIRGGGDTGLVSELAKKSNEDRGDEMFTETTLYHMIILE